MPCATSRRLERVQTPMIPVVGEWIAAHPGTISLGQGVVHYAPPRGVGQAVAGVAEQRVMDRYGPVCGQADLLAEIEAKLARDNQITLGSEYRVVTTAGSNMGFINAVLAIADVGDEVILVSPFYFNHEMAIEIVGCQPVVVPTDEDYQIDLAALESAIGPRTRAIVTVSPNNPTGTVYGQEVLAAVNTLCGRQGIYHIHDEAYEYFVYDGRVHVSPGALPEAARHTISLFSLSKAYGMAGWRCGYMVIPAHLENAVKKIQDTNLVCPPIVSQVAATAALRAGATWCGERICGFAQVRDIVIEQLGALGGRCHVPCPAGAFYALARLETKRSDVELVETLIRDFGVAVLPGSTFGAVDGCYIRIAYGALDCDTVAAGLGRLVRGLTSLM